MTQATIALEGTPKAKTKLLMVIAYIVLAIGMIMLDQTTKFHAEKSFLNWSHPGEVHQISSHRHRVFTWGVSPGLAFDRELPSSEISSNWLDFHLTYVRNLGAAWGALSTLPQSVRFPFFSLVTIIALGVVSWLFATSHPGQRTYRIGLVFILAGALGNFFDRIVLGYVIDWLHFHWKVFGWEYSFPVFNVADISINVGVGLIFVDLIMSDALLRRYKKEIGKSH